MLFPSRFRCPSASLTLKSLLKRARVTLWIGLALAAGFHAGATQLRGFSEEQKVAKPLTTQFVKREPRLTKPLELKKRPQPRRRTVRRTMVAVKARAEHGRRSADFVPSRVLGSLSRPRVAVSRATSRQGDMLEPRAIARAVEGSKEAKDVADLSLEMLDIEALDTGKYHALVVQDPQDKRSIRGFCHLAMAYSKTLYAPNDWGPYYSFENYFQPGFVRLAAAMNEYTAIKTDVLGRVSLDDVEIFKAPWLLFFGMWRSFKLTATELDNIGKYMRAGGFVFADSRDFFINAPDPSHISLRNSLEDGVATQGVKASFEKLPDGHPIYHCYFDFDGPPIAEDATDKSEGDPVHFVRYVEGLKTDGRLVAVLNRKGYAHAWSLWGRHSNWKDWNPRRQFQFGVNTIVFALTQEGSITQQLLDRIRY